MPLSLDQYATYLDSRDLPWPAAPKVEPVKAKPHVIRLPDVRVVTWSVYGTLVAIPFGDLVFEHPTKFVMDAALEKTIQEFKMWGSMSRKPGQPADYFAQIYNKVLADLRAIGSPGERHPEIAAEKLWEALLKKLMQKDYKFDASYFGSLNEYSKKIAYFFHASLQGTACYAGAADALQRIAAAGRRQGLIAHGQCFTTVQLQRGLAQQDADTTLDRLIEPDLRAVSAEVRSRKPSERLFRHVLDQLKPQGIEPKEVVHVGSSIPLDVVPARKLGMRTALFAGDKASLQATADQLKDASSRPDMMITELPQLATAFG